MSFPAADLPPPEDRTPAQWVTFYLRAEQAVSQGQRVRTGEGAHLLDIELPPLDEIRRQLAYWRRQQQLQSARPGRGCGSTSCYMPRL